MSAVYEGRDGDSHTMKVRFEDDDEDEDEDE
jgi:hypothetical protein